MLWMTGTTYREPWCRKGRLGLGFPALAVQSFSKGVVLGSAVGAASLQQVRPLFRDVHDHRLKHEVALAQLFELNSVLVCPSVVVAEAVLVRPKPGIAKETTRREKEETDFLPGWSLFNLVLR